MSVLVRTARFIPRKRRPMAPLVVVGLAIAVGIAFLVFANAHLVYVAVTSQPECVAHPEAGEATPGAGMFRAAKPSC